MQVWADVALDVCALVAVHDVNMKITSVHFTPKIVILSVGFDEQARPHVDCRVPVQGLSIALLAELEERRMCATYKRLLAWSSLSCLERI